ncbi:MAG: hypothetical protein QOI80_778 [Solirubrobacteraceae bacterium]|jgi:hypothetical protein|nr:hypothetical protein [Solirubrobacteraceae bacterium]
MGIRDRLTQAQDKLRDEISDARENLRDDLTARIAGPDGNASPEGFVLGLVRSARDDEDDGLTEKQVRKEARKRRRRLGIASFAAGPLAGAAGEATDLYTETATVCDLVELHGLTLTDLDIGAHMLVLWGLTDDLAEARGALDGTSVPITALISRRWVGEISDEQPGELTVVGVIKAMWKSRALTNDLRDAAGQGSFKRVLRAGAQTKEFMERAEGQLGVPQ